MPMMPRLTKTQRENYHYLAETLREVEFHLRGRIANSGLIPKEWEEIAKTRGPMPKVRITLWVEGDVVKFFQGMGTGYTTRMASVLRAFRHARLADVLRGAEGEDYTPQRHEELVHRISLLREFAELTKEKMDQERAEAAAAGKDTGPRVVMVPGAED